MTQNRTFADSVCALLPIIRSQLPKTCETAVDVGCGTGGLTARIAEFVPVILGIDSDPVCISAAKATAGQMPGLAFRLGHAEILNECVGSAQFHLILSTFALHHCENLAFVLEDLSRYLRPGGRLIVIDLFSDPQQGFHRSLFSQLIIHPVLYLPAFWKTALDFGLLTPLRLFTWRLDYAFSALGRAHMRSDFEHGLPPPLPVWRHAWRSALPRFSERILLGGIALFTWTNSVSGSAELQA